MIMADFEGSFGECFKHMTGTIREYFIALHEENKIAVEEMGVQMERDMVMAAPVGETGQLIKGITHRTEELENGDIEGVAGIPKEHPAGEYFAFMVFGTGRRGAISAALLGLKVPADYHHPKYDHYNPDWPGMSANPFPYEALAKNKPFFRKLLERAHKRAAERAKGKG